MVLVVGLFGMLLHNMVTFSLWTPGVGLVFWTAAGAFGVSLFVHYVFDQIKSILAISAGGEK